MAKKVLLADDSVTIQKVVGISLANEDLELITVDNGIDAIERAKAIRPDLILSDVVMPGKSGYEVAEAIKSDPNLRHIPIVLLTQTFETFDAERAKRIGVDGHITKPFEAQTLVTRVNAMLAAGPVSAPSAPAQAAAPAAAAASNDDYDFLGDGDLSRSGVQVAETVAEGTSGFDVEAGGAFDFAVEADEDGAARTQLVDAVRPAPAPAPDQTVAMMPDELPAPVVKAAPQPAATAYSPASAHPSQTIAIMDDVPLTADVGLDPLLADAAAAPDDSFDLLSDAGVEEEPGASTSPALQIDLSNPAATMIVTESSDDGFDFSFDAPPVERPAPAAMPTPEYDAPAEAFGDAQHTTAPALGPLPGLDEAPYTEEELFEAPTVDDAEPALEIADYATEAVAAEPFFGEDASAPAEAEAFDVETIEPMAEASAFEVAEAEAFEEIALEPAPAAPPRAPSAPAAAASVAISPEMREQIHTTIEKIAWEAMGDLSEQIIRQVVERVEAIAWEVIPQMTETLIQEEIQRLKKGS